MPTQLFHKEQTSATRGESPCGYRSAKLLASPCNESLISLYVDDQQGGLVKSALVRP